MNKILIISSVWVEPNSSAAGSRMLQLIRFFQSQKYIVEYASIASESEFAFDLSSLGIKQHSIQINDSSFDELALRINPNIVLFDRFMVEEQFGWRISNVLPNAIKILDTEDLHCLRNARQDAVKKNISFNDLNYNSDVAKREIASIFRCDLSLMISDYEMELLQTKFQVPKSILFYLPLWIDDFNAENQNYDVKQDFVFIGNFYHEPNWDSVLVLKNEIWPKLKELLPNAKMNIYGAYPSQKVYQLHNPKERFLICGRAESAGEVICSAKVLLAPIRFGAGIKGKLLECMEYGTPSVTTSIGAEAMHDNLPWNGYIADDYSDFIQKAKELYSNKEIWEEAVNNGFEIIKHKFLFSKYKANFIEVLNTLQVNIESHRNDNFIGQMLQFHTMRSTEFMSRWIEEKNK
ncbi:glycosyltransferase family 4 protein [Flavobacterium urocaniciphilum]|uniref:Glycosyltransferase involved in cell wall bisynthesis n=1 Tax=Flavobacterium urocaniciphilum TaxID=1299341 RepID=A0A1H9EAW7_9FLAO|nr:glycosyltransferase family 4 protein [Flavobacterium urocaniciphilum]SEQ22088.1 Glycosyltransferase involved in cell wall bisynthesis [Flavobacterium urocaniciphilum]